MSRVVRHTKNPEIKKTKERNSRIEERLQRLEERKPRSDIGRPKQTPEDVLESLKQNYDNLSDERSFSQLYNIPQKPATYLIYKDSEVIYVGSSIHVRTRLKQLLSGGGHIFHNKLRELYGSKDDVQSFLKKVCTFFLLQRQKRS